MSALADSSLHKDRFWWRRPGLLAALPLFLVLFASLLCLTARDSLAAAKGNRQGTALKFEAPPVELESPYSVDTAESTPPSAPAPAETRTATPNGTSGNEPVASDDAAKPIRLFGTVEFRSPIKNLPKWERVRDSESKKPSFVDSGMDTQNAAVSERWQRLRDKLKNAPLMEQIKGVNSFFNQWPYKTDVEIWGVEDYWETPREFVQKSGDCEDYAISKYYALRDLGVPVESLRVAAVKDSIRNLGHAVTIVFVSGDAYVLDNLSSLVLSHKKLMHYKPQYSVNEQYLWRHIQPQSGPTR